MCSRGRPVYICSIGRAAGRRVQLYIVVVQKILGDDGSHILVLLVPVLPVMVVLVLI